MLTVDAFRRVVDASVGHPGSMHDARVFRRSNLLHMINDKRILNGETHVVNNVPVPQVCVLNSLIF